MEYLLHIIILIGIYIILSSSLNLIAGYTGLISIAHASFYAIGAYVVALMALKFNTPLILNVPSAILFAAIIGFIIGTPSLRIHGDYFVIVTFAFQILTFTVLKNWISLTRGALGLPGIPQPKLLGFEISSLTSFLALTAALCALTLLILYRITHSPYGRILEAIREDEVFSQSIGKNVSRYKISVFVLGAGLASIGGSLYAYYISFIDPSSFTVMESIFIISIVIIGGAGRFAGPILGAIVLVMLPELLRFLGLPASIAANVRQILYGALLVAFMIWRPQGFIGKYTFNN
ncbi:MAG: branched-chain amino acid ABC transporter permease [Candidatus Zixiibacteriota bacterium]